MKNNIQNKKKKGFTIIEIVIAILIFTFAGLAILQTQFLSTKQVLVSRTLNAATQIGQRVGDSLEVIGLNAIDVNYTEVDYPTRDQLKTDFIPRIVTIDDRAYRVYTVVREGMSSSEPDGSGGVIKRIITKMVDITVMWDIGSFEHKTLVQVELH